MLINQTYERGNLRELASLISHAAFKKLSTSTNQSTYIKRMKKYIGWKMDYLDRPTQLSDLIAYSYNILEQHYRHEYIYKNKLLTDFVLSRYVMDDTVLLNEFKIGQSIADSVLINGSDKVFEIKTELDTSNRLQGQLQDYYKAFTEVYVFTHFTLAEKYVNILPTYVGLLLYNMDGSVSEYRSATKRTDDLDSTFIMASLRKSEYTNLVNHLSGFIPEATPAFYYRTCLEVLKQFPVDHVQQAYCTILKQRIDVQTDIYLTEGALPTFMNFSFYQSKFNKKSYLTMINNLSKNIL